MQQHTSKSLEDSFYIAGWIMLLLSLLTIALYHFSPFFRSLLFPGCPFHLLTGYYCPGCGGTRAVAFLFHGQVLHSVYYHPFVIYGACIGGWFMFSQTLERISRHRLKIGMHYHNTYIWIAVIVIIGNWMVKNILHYYGIVNF